MQTRFMKALRLALGTTLILSASACLHTERDENQRSYATNAEDRIYSMRGNIKSLQIRESQLLGEPRDQLQSAVERLKTQTALATAELKELRERGPNTWIEKKDTTDKVLYQMDTAYSDALKVLQAH